MSSRAFIIDKIHCIGELLAETDHLEEKILASEDEEEKAQLSQMIEKTLDIRREMMASLMGDGENPEPMFACSFKHACKAFTLQSEVYEATHSEEDLARLKNLSDLLAMVSSKYFGFQEFQTCGRCFADLLLAKQLNPNGEE